MAGVRIARRLLLVAGALALALPALAPAAVPAPTTAFDFDAAPVRFAVPASNGYRVAVSGEGRWVTLTASGRGGSATYTVRGHVSRDGIEAELGDFGRVAVEFRPGRKTRRVPPSSGCRGADQVLTHGSFVGTIRFRGEGGYTRVRRDSAPGRTLTAPRWRCPGRGGGKGAGRPVHDEALGAPVLAAFAPEGGAVFAALGEKEGEDLDLVFFVAGTRERSGPVRIARLAVTIGATESFAIQPGLGAATVSPPHPFVGTAGFLRNPDGSTAWSGSLAAPLPGAGTVPLTGAGFRADLRVPQSFGELLELLGQPDLPGL